MMNAIIQKAAGFLFRPAETFRNSKDDTPREVATYYLTLFALNLVLISIFSLLAGGIKPEVFTDPDISVIQLVITAVLFIGPTQALVAGTIGLLIFGFLFHILVWDAGGRNTIFTTFKVVMYSLTPVLLTGWLFELFLDSFVWISYLKGDTAVIASIIAFVICFAWIIAIPLWTLEFLYHGIIEVHLLSSEQAHYIKNVTTIVFFIDFKIMINF